MRKSLVSRSLTSANTSKCERLYSRHGIPQAGSIRETTRTRAHPLDVVCSHHAFRSEKNIMMHFVLSATFSVVDFLKHLPLYGFGFVR